MVTLFCFLLAGFAVGHGTFSPWIEGSGGASGECVCEAFLPNTTFPIKELISIENTAVELRQKLELEISKVEMYESKLQIYIAKIRNLTVQVEQMEDNPDSYSELQMQEVKIKIKQVEALIVELQASVQITTVSLVVIRKQISVMIDKLTLLEVTYDKSLVLVTRREYIILQHKLEECDRRHNEIFNPNIGYCNHGGIRKISKPLISQLNADLNAAYRFGGWGKDSLPVGDSEGSYWYSGLGSSLVERISQYSDYYKLIMRQSFKKYELYDRYQYDWHGTGNNYIVRANTFYYQFRTPFSMAKYNMSSMTAQYKVVPKASTLFSYHYSADQNLDFAADESGLWLTYATEESKGKLMLAKIDEEAFEIKQVWQTSVFKPTVGNTFMACGVLYATRSVDSKTEEIFYSFNTRTQQERHMSIPFEKFQDSYVYLDYNPTDQKLYMYNNGFYVNYHVWFDHVKTNGEF